VDSLQGLPVPEPLHKMEGDLLEWVLK